jgi:hypothetical protein
MESRAASFNFPVTFTFEWRYPNGVLCKKIGQVLLVDRHTRRILLLRRRVVAGLLGKRRIAAGAEQINKGQRIFLFLSLEIPRYP